MQSNQKKATLYRLLDGKTPLYYYLASKSSKTKHLSYFDESFKNEEGDIVPLDREIRYARNQNSPFVDEQKGQVRATQVVFEDGALIVQYDNPQLKNFLKVHPDNAANGGKVFEEVDNEKEAREEMEMIDFEFEQIEIAKSMSITQAESIIRHIKPGLVDKMDSDEIRRDAMVLARNNPFKFRDLYENPTTKLKNVIGRAFKLGTIYTNSSGNEIWLKEDSGESLVARIPPGAKTDDHLADHLLRDPDMFMKIERLVMVNE